MEISEKGRQFSAFKSLVEEQTLVYQKGAVGTNERRENDV